MAKENEKGTEHGGITLSHRLAVIHVVALIALLSVVIGSVLWMSSQHDALAHRSATKMVQSGINAIRSQMESTVLDYSIWTEAYEAIERRDMDWLYSNAGTGAAEIGAMDLLVLVDPETDFRVAWRKGSPPGGEEGLIEPALLERLLALEAATPQGDGKARTAFAKIDGTVWAFAVTRVVPTDGLPAGADRAREAPLQLHGLRLTSDMLQASIGDRFLLEGMRIVAPGEEGNGSIALPDTAGEPIAKVTWIPPSPGGEILRRIALPLGLALLVAVTVGVVLSVLAVRSARQLEHALDRARAGERAKGEFVANISHELRTPMNGVIGLGKLLRNTPLTEKQGSMLDILLNSAAHQMRLIEELLEISEIEAGNRRIAAQRFDIARVVSESAEMVRAEAARKALELRVEIAPSLPAQVIGDEKTIRQILTNLLNNAVKFTEEGHVAVRLGIEHRPDGALCTVSVEDSGVGIPPEHQPRIFDRFYQGDMSIKRCKGGTGLGLSISRSLAELIDGTLSFESTPGRGSRFTLEMPVGLPKQDARVFERAA